MVDTSHQFAGLETIYLWIALAVFICVLTAILVAVIRYRRRSPTQYPTGKDERNLVESFYAFGLVCIAAFLIAATYHVENRVDHVTKNPGLRVNVVAAQWNWKFIYPGTGVSSFTGASTYPVLTVPTNTEISFHATSRDVIHSFWIPATRFKRDVFPHTTTYFDLLFDKPGWFAGECAEFCGLLHSQMRFRVHALPPAQFKSWLASQKGAAS